jgi:hypothetical protein
LVIDDAPEIRGLSSPVDLVRVEVDEHINLEEALVAVLPQPVSEPADVLDRDGPVLFAQRLRE